MAIRRQAPEFRSWMEHVAGSIGDPVKRLRFLRAVAPVAETHSGRRPRRSRTVRIALLLIAALGGVILLLARATARVAPSAPAPALRQPAVPERRAPAQQTGRKAVPGPASVWEVEKNGDSEVYSNGLRIDDTYAVSYRPRAYLAFPADGAGQPVRRSDPAGIVFHSTESRQAPFEAAHNEVLKRIGESLVDFIRPRHCYHFLIDRFGRVYRVVAEGDAADHAGYSVWADDRWVYVNLNESFLGVAFEARTHGAEAEPEITAAQARSAVMLIEMLRDRYGIPASNCVTHAQVSVNPSNMRVGYHVDWVAEFPFEELGLPDNYGLALPSIRVFGFECDPAFLNAAGSKMRIGAESAQKLCDRRAAEAGLTRAAYRRQLQERYRQTLAAVRHVPAAETGLRLPGTATGHFALK
jgi:N-acetylmuramoyl-L-alanine amidase